MTHRRTEAFAPPALVTAGHALAHPARDAGAGRRGPGDVRATGDRAFSDILSGRR